LPECYRQRDKIRDYVRRRWHYLLGLFLIPFTIIGPGWLLHEWRAWQRAHAPSCETEEERLRAVLSEAAKCQSQADCLILECASPDWCRYAANTRADQEALREALGEYFERCQAHPWEQDCLLDLPPTCEVGVCVAARLRCSAR
jgi:hypothetical protein